MRLLAYSDSRQVGGAELALGYLLGALDPSIEVGVLATDEVVGAAIAAHRPGSGSAVVRPPQGLRDRRALAQHRAAIRAFAPDVLHANQAHPWACGYAELAAQLLPRVRTVAVNHLPMEGDLPRVRREGRRLLARRFDAQVAVGEQAARLVERFVGLPAGSVRGVANGVPAAQPQALPRLAEGPVVGSVGRLTDQKGLDKLVRALPELPAATLVLVGDGPERAALEALAAQLGVADRLVVTGWTAQARAHLPGFDVFALPSGWEGMPLVILEAMHAGLPVVASDVGSVAEAVRDGETGYVVAPDDETTLRARLAALLGDADLRARLGGRGRELAAERFTDEAMARRYEAVYGDVLAGRGA
ncbi:MAG TPA: glycosyltransferase family 4 protein [Conexibacter sp.]|nr:glycosyltransferase family 4 protein [Conexibacter sp.]